MKTDNKRVDIYTQFIQHTRYSRRNYMYVLGPPSHILKFWFLFLQKLHFQKEWTWKRTKSRQGPRNLRYLLVRASLTAINQQPPGNHPCGAAGCKTCPILMATGEFTSHTTGQAFKINFAASCKPSSIIYLITSRRCGQQYVGETGQPLHLRINGHRYNITHRKAEESSVAEHFNDTLLMTWLWWQ